MRENHAVGKVTELDYDICFHVDHKVDDTLKLAMKQPKTSRHTPNSLPTSGPSIAEKSETRLEEGITVGSTEDVVIRKYKRLIIKYPSLWKGERASTTARTPEVPRGRSLLALGHIQ